MNISDVSGLLAGFLDSPEPFSCMTVRDLWTDPHIAQQMLETHLDPSTDRASRRPEEIDEMVAWINSEVGLERQKLCDLGCGPGLYAKRFAEHGARVTGIDFSASSIDYAKTQDTFGNEFLVADYLGDELPGGFDLVTLIYCDYCAFGSADRATLLQKIAAMLREGGRFVFDILPEPDFPEAATPVRVETNLMNGFWSKNDYVGFKNQVLYHEQNIVLDRYLIVESDRQRQFFNWLQYFSRDLINRELSAAGFAIETFASIGNLYRIIAINENKIAYS